MDCRLAINYSLQVIPPNRIRTLYFPQKPNSHSHSHTHSHIVTSFSICHPFSLPHIQLLIVSLTFNANNSAIEHEFVLRYSIVSVTVLYS